MWLRLRRILSSSLLFGLLLTAASAASAQQVAIEIHETPSDQDDYLCWSPVKARARLIKPADQPVLVTLKSLSDPNGGAAQFQTDPGTRPTDQTYQPQPTIDLMLPGDGSWKLFWVMGSRASAGAKDLRIAAVDGSGTETGSLRVMVRVRKDAEKLALQEISQFLDAVAQLHDKPNGMANSKIVKYVQSHDEAFALGIHDAPFGLPLFVAWHRAFLLSFERELQAIDPRVTIPYWRFDRPAPKLFGIDFLGSVFPGSTLVQFAVTNPLFGWQMPGGGGGMVRERNG